MTTAVRRTRPPTRRCPEPRKYGFVINWVPHREGFGWKAALPLLMAIRDRYALRPVKHQDPDLIDLPCT